VGGRGVEAKTALVATVAVLTLSGCSVGDDGSSRAETGDEPGREADGPTLTIAWGDEPASLEPGDARSSTAANVIRNVMDPLVKLDENLAPQPSLAAGWSVANDGKTVRFTLRRDGRWTNGDPVTAPDFEYSWKRTLSPELNARYARQLYGIAGAAAYNSCEAEDCSALRDAVGVEALGDYALEVNLVSPQPWFVAQTAHQAFLPVHRATVEAHGEEWTDPGKIVTNGPFMLEHHDDDSITLVKNPDWRDAETVELGRVEGRIIPDSTTRVQAFDAGDVMVLDGGGLPASDMPALRERAEYERYPALATYYYGFNLRTIADVHQRRAMSLAVDRRALIENVGQAELPAIGFTPPGTPGFEEIIGGSPWLHEQADMAEARAELERATEIKRKVNLFYNDAPGNQGIAEVIRDRWKELGIEATIRAKTWQQYLGFLRPPNTGVDVYQLRLTYDVPDPENGLRVWTCASEKNYSNFCDENFDQTMRRARIAPNAAERNRLYAAAEETLFGSDGALPVMPIYWDTYPNLEALRVKDTFFVNPLAQIDLTTVRVE
jgi:oligopeptide transport system substrate-binding protein